jgi:MFS family permease
MVEQDIMEKEGQAGKWSYRWLAGRVNFFLSFAVMSSFIFVPLLGVQLGASDFEVGVVGAVYGIAFLFSSLISGWKSDHLGRLLFVRWGLLISSMVFAAQPLAHSVRVQDIFLGASTSIVVFTAYAFLTSPFTLVISQVILGICVGGMFVTVPARPPASGI